MIYLDLSIIIIIIILFTVIKDIKKFLRLTSILTILSGYLIIIMSLVTEIIIKNKLKFINISKIINIFSKNVINRGLILILIGGVELVIYILLILYNEYKKKNY